jgi:predicted amidohydrolase YtcJ
MRADVTIYVAHRVLTPAPLNGPGAIAVSAERIIDVGGVDELTARWSGVQAKVVDLGEATLLPGFNDAHQHPVTAAEYLAQIDCGRHPQLQRSQLLQLLSERAAQTPAGEWVLAVQYDETRLAGPLLTRADLDAISTEHPILLGQVSAHWGIANSHALSLAGLHEDSPDPAGGELGRDEQGRLDGRLYEQAYFLYTLAGAGREQAIVPPPSFERRLQGLAEISQAYHAAGITSVTDALVTPDSLELYRVARERGQDSLRVNMLIGYPYFEDYRGLGISSGIGDERLRIGGFKGFMDGAISGRTAWLSEPYQDSEDRGIRVLDEAEAQEMVERVHRAGATLAVHANGDAAIAALLDQIERAQERWPKPDLCHRVEHCTVIDAAIVARLRRVRVSVTPFATFIPAHGEKLAQWYGAERLERMFAHRALLDGGVATGGASDHPVAPFEPLLGIQSCVTRTDATGRVLGASQRITLQEALALYTVGSAVTSGEQAVKGRLAPGQLADFTVLEGDLLAREPAQIAQAPVLATHVGGRRVWAA